MRISCLLASRLTAPVLTASLLESAAPVAGKLAGAADRPARQEVISGTRNAGQSNPKASLGFGWLGAQAKTAWYANRGHGSNRAACALACVPLFHQGTMTCLN